MISVILADLGKDRVDELFSEYKKQGGIRVQSWNKLLPNQLDRFVRSMEGEHKLLLHNRAVIAKSCGAVIAEIETKPLEIKRISINQIAGLARQIYQDFDGEISEATARSMAESELSVTGKIYQEVDILARQALKAKTSQQMSVIMGFLVQNPNNDYTCWQISKTLEMNLQETVSRLKTLHSTKQIKRSTIYIIDRPRYRYSVGECRQLCLALN